MEIDEVGLLSFSDDDIVPLRSLLKLKSWEVDLWRFVRLVDKVAFVVTVDPPDEADAVAEAETFSDNLCYFQR